MKNISFFLIATLCFVLLVGCSASLPGDVTKETAEAWAADTIDLLNEKDYDSLLETCTEEMHVALTESGLDAVWEPFYETIGAWQNNKKFTIGSQNGYVTVVVNAEYENATAIFTLSYTEDGALGGIYFR